MSDTEWHWMETAERVCKEGWLIGEDERGDLYVPHYHSPFGIHYTRFRKRNPLHWLAYWNSWRKSEIVMLESVHAGGGPV
jgi:hypothetical protein